MQIAEIRALTNKKYEILAELERARAAIVKEITDLDDCKVTRFREILESYANIESRINTKVEAMDATNKAIAQYAESSISDLKNDIKYLEGIKGQFDEIIAEFKKLENTNIASRVQAVERKLLALNDVNDRLQNVESSAFDTNVRVAANESRLKEQESATQKAVNDVAIIRSNYMSVPTLTQEQQTALNMLCSRYYAMRESFEYNYDCTRTIYESSDCVSTIIGGQAGSGHTIKINCSNFAQLIWAGVAPESFFPESGELYDGTFTKDFEWGYEMQFPFRKVYGVTKEDGSLYFYKERYTVGGEEPIDRSYSANTHYSETSEREDGQHFYSFMNVSDMARELYFMGCEIPINKVDRGDILFFAEHRLYDNDGDEHEMFAFRHITHCAIVYDVSAFPNSISMYESTPVMGGSLSRNSLNFSTVSAQMRNVDLMNRVVMVCRHPSAFGYAGNVGDRFTPLTTV